MENIPLKQTLYKKGEIIVYSYSTDITSEFVTVLLNRHGLELISQVYDNAFLIKCPSGKEIESADSFIKKYPEFFDSYEREDIRVNYIYDKIESIVDRVEKIGDFFGNLDKRNINTKSYNDYIDSIIKSLVEIKIK